MGALRLRTPAVFPHRTANAAEKIEKNVTIEIDYEKCITCGACIENCAYGALEMVDGTTRWVHPGSCESCGVCSMVCPEEAITMTENKGSTS
jgi:MinD superfamily P-loop ATPase